MSQKKIICCGNLLVSVIKIIQANTHNIPFLGEVKKNILMWIPLLSSAMNKL